MKSKYHKLVYTWKYEPKDLFQGKHNLMFKPYTITIREAKIIAEVYNTTTKGHHSIIQGHVENYFKAASIINGLGYTIDKDVDTEAFDENGERIPAMFVPSLITTSKASPLKMMVTLTDKEKQQVIEEEKRLGKFFTKYYHAENSIIRFISEYYKASLSEERFLIYLYDIIEAMCAFLYDKKEKKKRDKFKNDLDLKGLEKKKWIKIFELANTAIIEGRHAGSDYATVRNITPSEKAEIMESVKKIMLAFFKKLMDEPKLIEKLDQK